jgi:hypothetical protein
MVFPTVKRCCCCVSLTTGCLFIGCFSFFCCVIYVGSVLYEIADFLLLTPEEDYEISELVFG